MVSCASICFMVSSATPTTISMAVLESVITGHVGNLTGEKRHDGHNGQEESASPGQTIDDPVQIVRRGLARPDARYESALPLQRARQVHLLKYNHGIEEGKANDQHEIQHPVEEADGQRTCWD